MRRPILIVDDDPAICETLSEILEDDGHRVAVAHDGREALDYLRRRPDGAVGLILLDLMMPGMDGIAFLDRCRDDPRVPMVPVIVLTANPGMYGRKQGRQALFCMSKPIDVPYMLEMVDSWCA